MGAGGRWILVALTLLTACGRQPPVHEIVEADGRYVRLALAQVADGEVHFFTFFAEGTRVNFLVRTDSTGALQAHLDACYGCYQYRMGYVVEDENLVCRACRLEYPIGDEVWDFIGACAPIALGSALDGDDLVIERRVLERAARYF
jgi:uncharacterized membrane protein